MCPSGDSGRRQLHQFYYYGGGSNGGHIPPAAWLAPVIAVAAAVLLLFCCLCYRRRRLLRNGNNVAGTYPTRPMLPPGMSANYPVAPPHADVGMSMAVVGNSPSADLQRQHNASANVGARSTVDGYPVGAHPLDDDPDCASIQPAVGVPVR